MSLINDMLKDLDRRGARDPNKPESGLESEPDLMASSGASSRGGSVAPKIWWPGVFVSMAAAGLAVAVVIWFWEPSSSSETVPLQDAESDVNVERELNTDREVTPEKPAAQAVSAAEPSQPEWEAESIEQALQPRFQTAAVAEDEPRRDQPDNGEPSVQEQRLSELLELARKAHARDRLTLPNDDNAYDYYQQILARSPEHPDAKAGLAAIARRYRELVEMALDNNELSSARTYIQRARSIGPNTSGLEASIERLERLSAEQPTGQSQPVGSDAAEAESRLSVSPDMESRDRRRAQVARELWAQGDQTGALTALEETLADFKRSNARAPVSVTLLVELYIQADDPRSAEKLLEQSDYLSISEGTRLKAQLDLYQGDAAQALADLEAQLESAQANEPYRALLARLYFAEDQYPQAVAAYRALLSDFGEDPAYWLGLGLAEDAQGRVREALQAFVRARDRGDFSPENAQEAAIHRYLERRIEALTRELNAQDSY